MLQQLIARLLVIIFLLEIVFPAPILRAATTTDSKTLDKKIRHQVSAGKCVPQQKWDEKLRANNPFRQTELAKEIVCKHQEGAQKDSKKGVVARARKKATAAANVGIYHVPESIDAQKGVLKQKIVWKEALFGKWVDTELTKRIKAPDVTFGDLLDFIDPYAPSEYDPIVTTVAAEALNVWLQYLHINAATDLNSVEGIASYSSEIEQRVLYRLDFLETSSPLDERTVTDARAIGSLRLLLQSLRAYHETVLQNYPDLYDYYNWDSVLFKAAGNGHSLTTDLFVKILNEITTEGRALKEEETQDVNQFTLINTLVSYAVMQALLRDKSGTLTHKDGTSISTAQWRSVGNVMNRIDVLTNYGKRVADRTPTGNYLQMASILYAAFAATLQQSLTAEDLTGPRGAQLVSLLKKYADISKKPTPSVVIAAELASSLLQDTNLQMNVQDKQYFAKAVESIYCPSSLDGNVVVRDQNGSNAYVTTKDRDILHRDHDNPVAQQRALRDHIDFYFMDFGFEDVDQHIEFMRGLAKMHQAFGTPNMVLKKAYVRMDLVKKYEKSHLRTLPPSVDFYYMCFLNPNYQGSDVLKARRVADGTLAFGAEVLSWILFDGALRVMGKFVSPLFRLGVVGMESFPRAIAAAGKAARAARTGRLTAGVKAAAKEMREAEKLSRQMNKATDAGVSIMTGSAKRDVEVTVRRTENVVKQTAETTQPVPVSRRIGAQGTPAATTVAEKGGLPARVAPGSRAQSNAAKKTAQETVTEKVTRQEFDWRQLTSWRDFKNRYLGGFGAKRKPVDVYVLRQGENAIELDAKALGLSNGIRTLKDWKKLMESAKAAGFNLEKLGKEEMGKKLAEDYMSAQAAQKMAKQGWLTSRLPKATKYWKMEGGAWKQVSQKEFLEWYEGVLLSEKSTASTAGTAGGTLVGKSEEMKNYYEILGVNPNATTKEIESAYKQLASKYHPDRNMSLTEEARKELEKKFNDVVEAKDVLSNSSKRKAFDLALKQQEGRIVPTELAITLNGKTFNGANGLLVSSANGEVRRDLVGAVKQYMQENSFFTPRELWLAKHPWMQTGYTIARRDAPILVSLDYLFKDSFKNVLLPRINSEQNQVLSPFQPYLNNLTKGAPEGNEPLYNKVSAVDPFLSTYMGMPAYSFAGAFLGAGLYRAWDKVIEPLSPWKLTLLNDKTRKDLFDSANYSLTSASAGKAQEQLFKNEDLNITLRAIEKQRDQDVQNISQIYGPQAATEATVLWNNYAANIQKLFTKMLSAQKLGDQIEELKKDLDDQLDVLLSRWATLKAISSDKAEFLKRFQNMPPAAQNQVLALYNDYEKQVRSILSNPKDHDKWAQQIQEANSQLLQKVAASPEVLRAIIQQGMLQNVPQNEQPTIQQASQQTGQSILQNASANASTVDDVMDFSNQLLTQYEDVLEGLEASYPEDVIVELRSKFDPMIAQLYTVAEDANLSDEQKRQKMNSLRNETFSQMSALLEEKEPDYNKTFQSLRQDYTWDSQFTQDSSLPDKLNTLLDQREEQLKVLLEETSSMEPAVRREKLNIFFVQLNEEYIKIKTANP